MSVFKKCIFYIALMLVGAALRSASAEPAMGLGFRPNSDEGEDGNDTKSGNEDNAERNLGCVGWQGRCEQPTDCCNYDPDRTLCEKTFGLGRKKCARTTRIGSDGVDVDP